MRTESSNFLFVFQLKQNKISTVGDHSELEREWVCWEGKFDREEWREVDDS